MRVQLSSPEIAEAMGQYLLGDRAASLEAFEKLSAKYPALPVFPLVLGNIKYSLGRLEEACLSYKKAIELQPDYGEAYFKLGVCLVRMGRLSEALNCFRKDAEKDVKGHVMSHYWMGLINSFLGDDTQSIDAFTRLYAESPESRLANFFLAQLYMKRNEHKKALALLQELLVLSPDFAEAHYLLGLAYGGLYKNFDAIRCFRKALELNPSDKRAQTELERYTEVPGL
jgi:tetratricopeptide (TPR) repeat protein